VNTPVGEMTALATSVALCGLEFGARRPGVRFERRFPSAELVDDDNHLIAELREWLARYFAGESVDAASLRLDLRGGPFEQRVWTALLAIPPGETVSYGHIARKIGAPGAARAVGMANGANPVAIVVPCHRVVGADGSLTGYGGGLDRKRWLLCHEQRWQSPLFSRNLRS
jgi:O-6-methylguanine DNA methyltransferase